MTDPHEPLKFKINNSLSRIRHRKPATRGAWCSLNSLEIGPESLYIIIIWYYCGTFHIDVLKISISRHKVITSDKNRVFAFQNEMFVKWEQSNYLQKCIVVGFQLKRIFRFIKLNLVMTGKVVHFQNYTWSLTIVKSTLMIA